MTERDDMNDEEPATERLEPDDARLMAYILAPEDDPALETAARTDPALHAHLEALRADVAAIGAGLDRVVPAAPEDYTDLNDPRWEELHELVSTPAPAAPRRRPAWLRVLAPATAIALVLLAGVVGVQYLGGDTAQLSTTTAEDKAAEGFGDENGALEGDAQSGAAEGVDGAAAPSLSRSAPNASAYATVLVARARTPGDFRQRFDVVRVLRGNEQQYGEGTVVTLNVVDRAVAPDRLVVLYLTPAPVPAPAATASASAVPHERDLGPAVVTYGFRGGEALVLQLPADTDPDALALP